MTTATAPFEARHPISFGDCDPAGILFYPHHFRLMDATFQAWLRAHGLDQARIRATFQAVGTGLLGATARFRRPVRDGETLRHALAIERWEARVLHLRYEGFVEGALAVEGTEARGLFVREHEGLRLADLGPLRLRIEAGSEAGTKAGTNPGAEPAPAAGADERGSGAQTGAGAQ